ncbi:hypothetical protein CGCTS75_v002519 [Colletotrichum tropicale]|nr:hypothetical protein CGCTS75_v002519 [Colletotrichum tropicale]
MSTRTTRTAACTAATLLEARSELVASHISVLAAASVRS